MLLPSRHYSVFVRLDCFGEKVETKIHYVYRAYGKVSWWKVTLLTTVLCVLERKWGNRCFSLFAFFGARRYYYSDRRIRGGKKEARQTEKKGAPKQARVKDSNNVLQKMGSALLCWFFLLKEAANSQVELVGCAFSEWLETFLHGDSRNVVMLYCISI